MNALRLAGLLGRYWYRHGESAEGAALLERALAGAQDPPPSLEALALRTLGVMAEQRQELDRADGLMARSLQLYRRLGDRVGEAHSRNALGLVARSAGGLSTPRGTSRRPSPSKPTSMTERVSSRRATTSVFSILTRATPRRRGSCLPTTSSGTGPPGTTGEPPAPSSTSGWRACSGRIPMMRADTSAKRWPDSWPCVTPTARYRPSRPPLSWRHGQRNGSPPRACRSCRRRPAPARPSPARPSTKHHWRDGSTRSGRHCPRPTTTKHTAKERP